MDCFKTLIHRVFEFKKVLTLINYPPKLLIFNPGRAADASVLDDRFQKNCELEI